MSGSDKHSFSVDKIFAYLFAFTAAEVAWGYVGHAQDWPKWIWWGGLCAWAVAKGVLILMYFMHFKFEGWIIKGLIVPTPILICVVLIALSPDIAFHSKLDNDIGAMVDVETGKLENKMEHTSDRPAPKLGTPEADEAFQRKQEAIR